MNAVYRTWFIDSSKQVISHGRMARYKMKPAKMYSVLPSTNRINGFKMLYLKKWKIISGIAMCLRDIDTEGTWCCKRRDRIQSWGDLGQWWIKAVAGNPLIIFSKKGVNEALSCNKDMLYTLTELVFWNDLCLVEVQNNFLHLTKASDISFHTLFDVSNKGNLNFVTESIVKLTWKQNLVLDQIIE